MNNDVLLRTGEVSRLRRRGALHGRRPSPPSYVSLTCGAKLGGWRFKFSTSVEENTDPFLIARRTSKHQHQQEDQSPIEFPSTGCNARLTEQAYTSSNSSVYKAEGGSVRGVLPVEALYLDEEQKALVEGLVCESFGTWQWGPLACEEWSVLLLFIILSSCLTILILQWQHRWIPLCATQHILESSRNHQFISKPRRRCKLKLTRPPLL
jgi:hypothetical protein